MRRRLARTDPAGQVRHDKARHGEEGIGLAVYGRPGDQVTRTVDRLMGPQRVIVITSETSTVSVGIELYVPYTARVIRPSPSTEYFWWNGLEMDALGRRVYRRVEMTSLGVPITEVPVRGWPVAVPHISIRGDRS